MMLLLFDDTFICVVSGFKEWAETARHWVRFIEILLIILNYYFRISAQDSISSSGGSLPNLPSPLHKMQNNNNNNNSNAAGASFGYPSSSYGSGGGGQTTMVQQHTHVPIQQRHSIQLPPGGTGYPQSHGAYNLVSANIMLQSTGWNSSHDY